MAGLVREIYEVYSKKHQVKGKILDYGFMIKLQFTYEGKWRDIAINRPYAENIKEAIEKLGEEIIDTYIEKLTGDENNKARLYYWYVDEKDTGQKRELIAHGNVTGHSMITDSVAIHTSTVKNILINEEMQEAEIFTMNSVYHCPLACCDFEKQDEFPTVIPDYENIKRKYVNYQVYPTIEPGKVLLVLSNFDEYYFHSLYYIDEETNKSPQYYAHTHIGMFQDSFLINTEDYKIDLRYFPHYQNIEFYDQITDKKPLYLQNIGDVTLYASTFSGMIRLDPGDCKEVKEENAEKEVPVLPKGDLYPAGVSE